jgi:hypothetical protein
VSGEHWPRLSLSTCPGHRGVRGLSLRNKISGCGLVTRTVPEAPSPSPSFRLRLSLRSRGLSFWYWPFPWPEKHSGPFSILRWPLLVEPESALRIILPPVNRHDTHPAQTGKPSAIRRGLFIIWYCPNSEASVLNLIYRLSEFRQPWWLVTTFICSFT